MFSPTADQSLVDEIASDMASGPEEVGIGAFTGLLEWVASDYQRVRKKLSIPFVNINALHKDMPIIRDKIVFVPDSGHFIPQEVPIEFNAALEQALLLMQ
jgi:pimeloyl-ACP methyl ester carboxylesterase